MQGIVDQTKYQVIAIDQLVKADWNYKEENAQLSSKLAENMKRNGQIENIIVRELGTGFFEVVNGNHRLDALKLVGSSQVMAYNLGNISATEAYRIAIETNETKFQSDIVKLSSLISDVAKGTTIDDLLSTMPYSEQELNNFLGMDKFDWDAYSKQDEEPQPTAEDEENENAIHFKLTMRERMRWDEWCKRTKEITAGDWKESLMVLLTIAEKLTEEDIESALVG